MDDYRSLGHTKWDRKYHVAGPDCAFDLFIYI